MPCHADNYSLCTAASLPLSCTVRPGTAPALLAEKKTDVF